MMCWVLIRMSSGSLTVMLARGHLTGRAQPLRGASGRARENGDYHLTRVLARVTFGVL